MKRKNTKRRPVAAAPAILMRDPRSGVEVALFADDGPTPQRAQHDKIDTGWRVENEIGKSRRVVDSLTMMHRAGTIDDAMLAAGLRFRSDFDKAQLHGLRAADVSRLPGNGWGDGATGRIAARERVADAIERLGGHGSPLAEMCWWMIGAGLSIREFVVRARWSGRPAHPQQVTGLIQGGLAILARAPREGFRKGA